MNIISKLEELEAFADLMKNNVIILKKEIITHGESKKKVERKSLDLIAQVKAKRAISRLPKTSKLKV